MENELYHRGVLGMKWGVRRYQNQDGSLTPLGKKRYEEDKKKLITLSQQSRNSAKNAERYRDGELAYRKLKSKQNDAELYKQEHGLGSKIFGKNEGKINKLSAKQKELDYKVVQAESKYQKLDIMAAAENEKVEKFVEKMCRRYGDKRVEEFVNKSDEMAGARLANSVRSNRLQN